MREIRKKNKENKEVIQRDEVFGDFMVRCKEL